MAQIIKIGNSQGIRIPKPIVKIANLENQELDFIVLNEGLLITPEKKSRIGWQIDEEKRSEEHTSELQSRTNLVCRLLLEKKKKKPKKY